MTYTAAEMMDVALMQIGRMTMDAKHEKECRTCSKKHGVTWTLTAADARHHLDRHGYEKHVIVDAPKKEKAQ